jgi:hypothetical protein
VRIIALKYVQPDVPGQLKVAAPQIVQAIAPAPAKFFVKRAASGFVLVLPVNYYMNFYYSKCKLIYFINYLIQAAI